MGMLLAHLDQPIQGAVLQVRALAELPGAVCMGYADRAVCMSTVVSIVESDAGLMVCRWGPRSQPQLGVVFGGTSVISGTYERNGLQLSHFPGPGGSPTSHRAMDDTDGTR